LILEELQEVAGQGNRSCSLSSAGSRLPGMDVPLKAAAVAAVGPAEIVDAVEKEKYASS
jgi:hypothetical protein